MVANYCLHTIGTAKTVRYSSGAPAVIVFYGGVMAGFSTFDIIMAKYRV